MDAKPSGKYINIFSLPDVSTDSRKRKRSDDDDEGEDRAKPRRVNPNHLAERLGPDLVREMEVHIQPGAFMPSFAIRKDLQERYAVDRRHLYDYFHSRGLRVAKEERFNNLARSRQKKAQEKALAATQQDPPPPPKSEPRKRQTKTKRQALSALTNNNPKPVPQVVSRSVKSKTSSNAQVSINSSTTLAPISCDSPTFQSNPLMSPSAFVSTATKLDRRELPFLSESSSDATGFALSSPMSAPAPDPMDLRMEDNLDLDQALHSPTAPRTPIDVPDMDDSLAHCPYDPSQDPSHQFSCYGDSDNDFLADIETSSSSCGILPTEFSYINDYTRSNLYHLIQRAANAQAGSTESLGSYMSYMSVRKSTFYNALSAYDDRLTQDLAPSVSNGEVDFGSWLVDEQSESVVSVAPIDLSLKSSPRHPPSMSSAQRPPCLIPMEPSKYRDIYSSRPIPSSAPLTWFTPRAPMAQIDGRTRTRKCSVSSKGSFAFARRRSISTGGL